MSEKRKDSKGRNLKAGEGQRDTGQYYYQYKDSKGKRKVVYSWTLTPTDKTPPGKKKGVSLREKEKEIEEAVRRGCGYDDSITVGELVELYLKQKKNIRASTNKCYHAFETVIKDSTFSNYRITKVTKRNAKDFCLELGSSRAFGTVSIYRGFLHSVFEYAINELEIIYKNPFSFKLTDIMQNLTKPREALTKHEIELLMNFLRTDTVGKKHYDECIILLGTGLRIGEYCGLTVSDIDFEQHCIRIDHQLVEVNGKCSIGPPKSKAGIRTIFMDESVEASIKRLIERNKLYPVVHINGYSGFIAITKTGNPKTPSNYEHTFQYIVSRYNKKAVEKLPKITPHILRHTYCTFMAAAGMRSQALQYIMGHSNSAMTSHYTHMSEELAKEEFLRVYNLRNREMG